MKLYLYVAEWCEKCKDMEVNIASAFKLESHVKLKVDTKNIEDPANVQLLLDHGIRVIPTLVVVNKNNEMVDKVAGVMEVPQIRNLLNDCVS